MRRILHKCCKLTQPQFSLGKGLVQFVRFEAKNPPKTDVPNGHFAVYVGDHRLRHVVPVSYLLQPLFDELLQMAVDEFVFERRMGLCISCDEVLFESLTSMFDNNAKSESQGFWKFQRVFW